jgi:hypothetical protein
MWALYQLPFIQCWLEWALTLSCRRKCHAFSHGLLPPSGTHRPNPYPSFRDGDVTLVLPLRDMYYLGTVIAVICVIS